MIKKTLYRYYFTIMSALTALILVFMTMHPTADDITYSLANYTIPMLFVFGLILIWGVLFTVGSFVLFLSEKKREAAFLYLTREDVSDELEEKAVSGAIKRTFMFNLSLLALVFALSGVNFSYEVSDDGKRNFQFGYSVLSDRGGDKIDMDSVKNRIDDINPELKESLEKRGIKLTITDDVNFNDVAYIVPDRVFSTYGLLWLILLQFLAFKGFLYLERRKFL